MMESCLLGSLEVEAADAQELVGRKSPCFAGTNPGSFQTPCRVTYEGDPILLRPLSRRKIDSTTDRGCGTTSGEEEALIQGFFLHGSDLFGQFSKRTVLFSWPAD